MHQNIEILIAACIFATVFLLPWPKKPLDEGFKGYRSLVSFAAGVSVAYVFMGLLPELAEGSEVFVESVEHLHLTRPGYVVYAAGLVGFMLYWSLHHLVSRTRSQRLKDGRHITRSDVEFLLSLLGVAFYAWIVTYLLRERVEHGTRSIIPYAVAMALHFVSLRHGLRHEYGKLYDEFGKWVLALFCFLGWAMTLGLPLPATAVFPLLGFLAGSVIMSSTVGELPKGNEGRLWPFMFGGLAFAAVLLLV
jgi:hypothetical protein